MPPFRQVCSHCGIMQCGPVNPGLHAHVLGATHTVLAPHIFEHTGVVQSMPAQPGGQLQMSGPVQWPPFSQIMVQVAEMARILLFPASATYRKETSVSEVL